MASKLAKDEITQEAKSEAKSAHLKKLDTNHDKSQK